MRRVARDLTISWPAMVRLAGRRCLSGVGGDLVVSGTGIADLAGLGSLLLIGGESLVVSDNPSLPECEAAALVERLRSYGWAGHAEIGGNLGDGVCE